MEFGPLIAIVLPDLGGGGAERVHLELAREFLALGYAVEFVLLRAEGQLLVDLPLGAMVTGLGVTHFRQALGPLRRYFRARRPAFVLAAMWPLTAMTVIAVRTVRPRPRVLVGEHIDFVSGSREHRLSQLVMRRLGRAIYAAADAVVCVSAGARTSLTRITGFPTDRIEVVFNPVRPPVRIEPPAESEMLSWWRGANYQLVTAGRLTEQKDHATLLRAMAALPRSLNARLLVLGDGPELGRLEALVKELNVTDQVRLGGFVGNVPGYLGMASLLVMSSRWEGLPVILCEALIQGVSIVTTDCPSGPAEILDHGRYGRLVPVQDPQALADAILIALADTPDPEALKQRGEAFAPRRAAEHYLRLLDPAFTPPGRHATP